MPVHKDLRGVADSPTKVKALKKKIARHRDGNAGGACTGGEAERGVRCGGSTGNLSKGNGLGTFPFRNLARAESSEEIDNPFCKQLRI